MFLYPYISLIFNYTNSWACNMKIQQGESQADCFQFKLDRANFASSLPKWSVAMDNSGAYLHEQITEA